MNSEQQQQRIMGYFIEEAREHLQTIEQGVLNLQEILSDSESVNELFRAAHSIKGGSAMLGVSSIQHVSHRLEDFFKILKDNPSINVDERLKSLLLAGFDPLSELLDELQSNYKISDDLTIETNNRVKPIFTELESYLNQLLSSNESNPTEEVIAEKIIPQQKVTTSQQSVFQQEVTTKMRDMLQLFRDTDTVESRSQLQSICDYFQDVGNNFNLKNWTTLVTQLKNAIAQPNNTYRTLAPILIRELKEAQDLVLTNREAEIAVSAQLQNLLPYRFAEPEDDEVSTIFTTAFADDDKESENFVDANIAESVISKTSANIDFIDPDVDIDLFADQGSEDAFDLAEISNSSIDQMDWMDSEYQITENQHIDGPKVGDIELKSLAVLFENDDIDFDAAWEDVESNESNMANQGFEDISDSHDEFLDLLDNSATNTSSFSHPSSQESSMDQLFGDFPTDETSIQDNDDSLFPEDLRDSWQSPVNISGISTDIVLESEQSGLDELFTEDFVNDNFVDYSLNNQLDSDLGIDIVDQISDSQASQVDELIVSDDISLSQVNISEINIDEWEFSDDSPIAAIEQQFGERSFIDFQDQSESLSSEAYFAELQKQENENATAIIDGFTTTDESSEPFALTFSEEGMALLEDPFAIDAGIDQVLLEDVNHETFESVTDVSGIDDFLLESEDNQSQVYVDTNVGINKFDNDTSGLNIFDELGFDNDEISESFLESVNFVSDASDQVELSDGFIENPSEEAILTDSLKSTSEDAFGADFAEFMNDSNDIISDWDDNSVDNSDKEIDDADVLSDFFIETKEAEIISDNIIDNQMDSLDDLGSFFTDSEESEIVPKENVLNIEDEFNSNSITNNTDALSDFFAGEVEPQDISKDIDNDGWEEFDAEITNRIESSANNLVDLAEDAFIDFDTLEETNLDFLDVNTNAETSIGITDDFFTQDIQDNSTLDDLFSNDGKSAQEDFDLIENEFNFAKDDSEETAPNLSDEIYDLATMDLANTINEDFQDSYLQTMDLDSDLTNIQDDLDLGMEQSDLTAQTTIDNLADFFQGDDDSDVSLLVVNEQMPSDRITDEAFLESGEFDGFTDQNSSEPLDSFFAQPSALVGQNEHQQLHTEEIELNGIDDNFDFDDLDAMISGSGSITSEVNNLINNGFDGFDGFEGQNQNQNQNTETLVSNQINYSPVEFANSGDMDFDELEALLGDSSDVTIPNVNLVKNDFVEIAVVEKPADEFDELENMLQSAFAKDVGPIKTNTRTTTATRKPKITDSTMRVDVKYLDSLNNLVGELVVNRNLLEQDQERLQQFITSLLSQVQLLSDVSQRMRDQYDRSLLEASLTAGRGNRSYSIETASYSNDGGSSNSSVSNDFEGIEFDRYNAFHILSQEIIELIVRVRESSSDIEFVVGETDQVTRQLGTITTQIQDDLKQSRMVPFAQIADRLPRGIRDRALKSGKQAELEIFGRETLIDKAILESLTDPLTHLVNNAIDHGLEDPTTRQSAGKSGTGRLTVRAYHQGNQTVISISDDGAGISTDRVKKSAVSKGVRSQSEVDQLNDIEVYSLLFEAGFSTAAQADEFKGRGVGLDVVKTCLDDIRGVIIVESTIGKGTTFTIRLPLTLSISKAMFCISDRARIAFPVDGFEDMVEVPQGQIVLNEKGQPCLPWRDTLLPFQHLSNLLAYSRHLSRSSIYGKQENDEICIIILRNDMNYLALQVDQFLGEYEIVIKQLEGPIPQPAGIAGATVLGDGRVMAIANVLELFDIASGRLRPSTSGTTIQTIVEEDVAVDPTVLIVDDSITVRELLSLTFAKVGYRVEQAKDGQDAWEKLRAGLPCDMIFCDIEMPRMDGLELLSRLQKDARLKEIPVAMLTSRGADRHRQTAIQHGAKGYFTKPYLEEELLSASKRLLAGETLPI